MTTFLDLVGVAMIAAFSYFVFAPLPLLVVGVACLLVSRKLVAE